MRGAAASGTAASTACSQRPLAKIRAAPTGRRQAKQCTPGAGRGSPRPWESTAPPADGAVAAADDAMPGAPGASMILQDAALLLGGAVAGVGLAEGRGLFLKLFTGGSHLKLLVFL